MQKIPHTRRLWLTFGLIGILILTSAGMAQAAGPTTPVTPALKKVETKKVCMINNQVFEKDQIPIQVQGRTYYGCCEMCKERLAQDAGSRTAVDPVTGKKVDKAAAVIAAKADGNVLYFENGATFARYVKGERKK